MTKTEMKKIAAAAFHSEFGVEPKLKDIVLLESGDVNGVYIMFQLGKHEWQFNSKADAYGAVFVGNGTLEMYA